MELVIGSEPTPPVRSLIAELKNLQPDETLYIGYPVLATPDETTFIDAMLISRQHGVVVFDIGEDDPNSAGFWDVLTERQDNLFSAVFNKLFAHESLRKGRELAIDINVVTYLPRPGLQPPSETHVLVAGPGELPDRFSAFQPLEEGFSRPLNAIIQRVTVIKPRKRRSSVRRQDSRGAILKAIEKEIANLDRWQNHAAIETPEDAQRIRGLAGSGKTVVLALKAAFLHVKNPDWNIAVTFQTRSLYPQFEDFIRRFTFEHTRDEPDTTKLKVIHAWGGPSRPGVYYEIAAACGATPRDFGYGQRKYGWEQAFEGVCAELLQDVQRNGRCPIYDAVLIDEAQDFPRSFFRLVHHATRAPKRIVWAYDELQNLGDYRMAPPQELFGVGEADQPLVTLHNREGSARQDIILPVCYRNTPWALATAHALGFGIYRAKSLVQYFDEPRLWHEIGYERTSGENEPGKRVTLARRENASPSYFFDLLDPHDAVQCHVFQDRDKQAEWVAERIADNVEKDELEFSDILIILPDAYTAKSESAVIVNALQRKGLDSHLAGVTSSVDELFLPKSIAICHIHRAKGNEAPMVYVLNSQYGYEGSELIKRRNSLFTAITRSRAWVRICGHGSAMQDLKAEIDSIFEHEFKLVFRVPTPSELADMRRIHRDMTGHEQAEIKKMEDALAKFVEGVERGDLSEDFLSRELRARLRNLLTDE